VNLLYPRCAGLDVHKKTVSACLRIRRDNRTEIKTAVFATFTQDLEELRDWLRQHQVQQVAMESTGVYWIPVWNILERCDDQFELTLVNPQHVHALPGRKTDGQDSKRIAELLQYTRRAAGRQELLELRAGR
jgi:transposase